MTVEERIKEKRDELMQTFAGLSEDELKVASGLIDQAAFLSVALADLADTIKAEGLTEEYTNGTNQAGRKISSNAKAYTSLVGKYTTITTKLLQLVPHNATRGPSYSEIMDALGDDAKKAITQGYTAKRGELKHEIGYRDYVMGAFD